VCRPPPMVIKDEVTYNKNPPNREQLPRLYFWAPPPIFPPRKKYFLPRVSELAHVFKKSSPGGLFPPLSPPGV